MAKIHILPLFLEVNIVESLLVWFGLRYYFRYAVELNGTTKLVPHTSSSAVTRVSAKFEELGLAQSYRVTVKCRIQGEDCAGIPPNFYVSTTCLGK